MGDLLIGLGAAGGLLALKKGWDMFGKGTKLQTGLAKIGLGSKTKAAQAALDREDQKQKDKETKATASTIGLDKDEEGNLANQKDAQAYKDRTDKAPSGWKTSPKNSPGKGKVWTTDDQTDWDAEAKDREAAGAEKQAALKAKLQKKQADKTQGKLDKAKASGKIGKAGTSAKSKQKADRKAAAKKELEKRAQQNQSFIPIPSTLSDLEEEDRTQLLEELVLEETMTLQESNELQAIMALDDVGISAEINRKGQLVVKKKDLKKAEKALKKSFKKGGEPKLVGEEVEIEENNRAQVSKVADEIEALADKGGAEAPALFSIANNLRKGKLPTGLKVSKKVSAIFKKHGVREEVQKPRTSYEIVSEARKRAATNKPKWEPEDSEPRLS